MAYLSNTPDQQRDMLRTIGVDSVDALFEPVPEALRLNRELQLPAAMTEIELESHLRDAAGRNGNATSGICFQGGGAYDHFIPATVDEIAGRGEFYTAYTPYQAEASQGSLQAFFEYQTLICQLTGMDVSNASLYDGATSVNEAAFMAMRVKRRRKVVLLGSVHPEHHQVFKTYSRHADVETVIVPTPLGTANLDDVAAVMDDRTACLIVQHPNFFGCLEDVQAMADMAHRHDALFVVSFDPTSLGLLQRPGDYDADIAVADGQSLGIPLQYGGPYLGIFACREKYVRQMPGRLVGRTVDRDGRSCFTLTLQAREQHIRREKATSNICTNQGLLALRATVFLSLLGRNGLKELATLCCQKAHYAAEQLTSIDGIELLYDRPFFKEFTLHCRRGVDRVIQSAREAGIDLGPSLSRFTTLTTSEDGLLIAVTEKRTRVEIDRLVDVLR